MSVYVEWMRVSGFRVDVPMEWYSGGWVGGVCVCGYRC